MKEFVLVIFVPFYTGVSLGARLQVPLGGGRLVYIALLIFALGLLSALIFIFLVRQKRIKQDNLIRTSRAIDEVRHQMSCLNAEILNRITNLSDPDLAGKLRNEFDEIQPKEDPIKLIDWVRHRNTLLSFYSTLSNVCPENILGNAEQCQS
jgi:hypothetical protein